jgi:hypothetical protein
MINFTEQVSIELLRAFRKLKSISIDPSYWMNSNLDGIEEPYRSALHSFFCNIYAFTKEAEHEIFNCVYLVERSLSEGPAFAKWISKFKDFAFVRKNKRWLLEWDGSDFYDYAPLVDDIPDEEFSVSLIYRSNSLFTWVPPVLDPIPYIMKPAECDESLINEFRQTTRAYLNSIPVKCVPKVLLTDIIKDTTSICRDGLVWEQEDKDPAKKRDRSEFVNIPRELKEQRSAVKETYGSLLRIRWIEANIAEIIKTDKRYGLAYDNESLEKMLKKSLKPNIPSEGVEYRKCDEEASSAYCRDFEKEGLTKPFYMINVMMEELLLHNPQNEAFFFEDFFSTWSVLYDKKELEAERGHGLGMGNELTTLMQFIIEDMLIKRTSAPKFSVYTNDDACLVFHTWDQARKFYNKDRSICQGLGLAFKEKASFLCRGACVFCEVYASFKHPKINDKRIWDVMSFHRLFSVSNYFEARSYYLGGGYYNIVQADINRLLHYWGVAFFQGEHLGNEFCGGWHPQRVDGLIGAFVGENGARSLSKKEWALHKSYVNTKYDPLPWIKGRKREMKITKRLDPKFVKLMHLPKLTPQKMFRSTMNATENYRAWDKFSQVIRNKFSYYMRSKQNIKTLGDLYDLVVEENPQVDIMPPANRRSMSGYQKTRIFLNKEIGNPFSGACTSSMYTYWELIGSNIEYYYLVSNIKGVLPNHKATMFYDSWMGFNRVHLADTIDLLRRRGKDVYSMSLFQDEALKYYHNPLAVAKLCDEMGHRNYYFVPDYIPNEKIRLLNMRNAIFEDFNAVDWYRLNELSPENAMLYSFIDRHIPSDDLRKIAIDSLMQFPRLGRCINISKNINSIMDEMWLFFQEGRKMQKESKQRMENYVTLDVEEPTVEYDSDDSSIRSFAYGGSDDLDGPFDPEFDY